MGRNALLLFWSLSFLSLELAMAYTPTVTSAGARVTWRPGFKLNLAGNPINRSGLSEAQFRAAVVLGLQRWKAASGSAVSFDYWQGTNPAIYENNSDFNGLSSIYFGSLPSNVLGLTQVWFDTTKNEILEADIVLNDRDFEFTNDPRDTSSSGSNRVYVGNVITHELGHVFGLSHSGGLQSTMFFMESPEQAHLGCDDEVGIRASYGQGGETGTLTGVVTSESGVPVFGAHVLAISRRRGVVLATGITDRSGRYSLSSLETGTYFLMVEPFFAGASALPSYFAQINSSICPGRLPFNRGVLMQTGDDPMSLEVRRGGKTEAPVFRVYCGGFSGAAITRSSQQAVRSVGHGFGIVDRLDPGGAKAYTLIGLKGDLEIHALSYSVYSPIQVSMSLASNESKNGVYEGESGFVNFDSELTVRELPAGNYVLRVQGQSLRSSLYPAGAMMVDSAPFFVITGSFEEGLPPESELLPVNARCLLDERSFPAYSSPPGDPPRESHEEEQGGGFCGTIGTGRIGGGGPSGPGAIAGFFLPWLVIGGIFAVARRKAMAACHPSRARLEF